MLLLDAHFDYLYEKNKRVIIKYINLRDSLTLMSKETSTVIKKILPYLQRQGYSIQNDLFFEETVVTDGKVKGFTDIEVKINNKLQFIIEVKRNNKKITDKHRIQVINYGGVKNVPFVIITNGNIFEMINMNNSKNIRINGEDNICPSKKELYVIMNYLKAYPDATNIKISATEKKYIPSISLNELKNVFKRCHNSIRDIEKDDEHAFSDFSKLLFLKLLEEKADEEEYDPNGFKLPYTLRFNKIIKYEDDAIKANIHSMYNYIQDDTDYGEVLKDDFFYIQNSKTYSKIVKELANIQLSDTDVDVKGSAFEYFLKYNLKGSQLGQYFTPREVVRLMIELVDLKKIVFGLVNPENKYLVVDPACGSGGFLITGMQRLLSYAKELLNESQIDDKTFNEISRRIKKEIFFGCDAKHMLVRTAKMNMIIAGDGFTNIKHGNSLAEDISFLQIGERKTPLADYVLTNPPFGMNESELDGNLLELYDVPITRAQVLFLQKMIKITKPNGFICTIIDEGILNTQSMIDIRKYIVKTCFIEAIIHLPYVTFEPNYARVSTSILLLKKKELEISKQDYPIFMYNLKQIGYSRTGKPDGPSSDDLINDLILKYRTFKNETR